MIRGAYQSITAERYEEAAKALEPIAKASANDARANLGLGYALLKLGRVRESVPPLEIAYAAQPADRGLALTLACALQDENPMRGARVLKDFIAAHAQGTDEEMQNALGSILNRAAKSSRVNKEFFYEECRNFYMQYDQRLGDSRGDRQRHWGAQWIDSQDAQKKWDTVISRERSLQAAARNAELSIKATAKAKDRLGEINNGFGLYTTGERVRAREDYDASVAYEKSARASLDEAEAAMRGTEQPPFQDSITVPSFWKQ